MPEQSNGDRLPIEWRRWAAVALMKGAPLPEVLGTLAAQGFPEGDAILRSFDLAELDLLAREIRSMRNRAAHSLNQGGTLTGWLIALADAVEPLRGLDHIPLGALHYGAFQGGSSENQLDIRVAPWKPAGRSGCTGADICHPTPSKGSHRRAD